MDNEIKWKKTDNYGVCRFCGQYRQFTDTEDESEALRNERTTRTCDCKEAKRYTEQVIYEEKCKQKREEKLAKAGRQIEELFGESAIKQKLAPLDEKHITLLSVIVEHIYDNVILKCTIDVTSLVKACISKSAKGDLQIQRTDKLVSKLEV